MLNRLLFAYRVGLPASRSVCFRLRYSLFRNFHRNFDLLALFHFHVRHLVLLRFSADVDEERRSRQVGFLRGWQLQTLLSGLIKGKFFLPNVLLYRKNVFQSFGYNAILFFSLNFLGRGTPFFLNNGDGSQSDGRKWSCKLFFTAAEIILTQFSSFVRKLALVRRSVRHGVI